MIVAASQTPEIIEYARAAGAKGVNLAGICCTANEILMRQGVPAAGNFLQQELAILTGAVEAMVVDVQCIMQALVGLAENFHTLIITTSPKVKIKGATHIEFDEHKALTIAKQILRTAIDNFKNRGETQIPDVREDLIPGFSHEYINYMLGGSYRASFRPLNDAIISGRIGAWRPLWAATTRAARMITCTPTSPRNCSSRMCWSCRPGAGAIASAKLGLLLGEAGLDQVGPGLREICEAVGIPPVLHMGSCVDNTRILTVLTQMVEDGGLGEDIDQIPAVGLAPEWIEREGAGDWCLLRRFWRVRDLRRRFPGQRHARPGERQRHRPELHSSGWEKLYGGKLEFVADPDEMIRRALAHIDQKRAALGLVEYRPESGTGAAAMRASTSWSSCPGRAAAGPLRPDQPVGGKAMSRYIATRAIRGANALVAEAEVMLHKALAEKGPDTPVAFPNTAYYLPLIFGMTGRQVETIGQLEPILQQARGLLHPMPSQQHWTPYLGETLDSGMATLLAAEVIEALRFVYGLQPEPMPGFHLAGGTSFTSPDNGQGANGHDGHLNGPIDDIQLRTWGIQLVDGRMPGFAAIVGAAKSNEVAVRIVRELQRRNILCFLSGNVNGRSIIHQLMEEGVELGYDTYTVPFGTDTISAIYALGFAVRSALTFGGMKGGMARDILMYNKERVFAFVLALGEVDDLKYAAAAGAINFGFPVIADTIIPEILPTGVTTYEHVVSLPFNEIDGADDLERAERLVQKCIEVRGVKVKVANVPVPVPYGSAFEGEVVRKADMRIEFGGKYSRCFEYLTMAELDAITDGKVEVIGGDYSAVEAQGHMDMGIEWSKLPGARCRRTSSRCWSARFTTSSTGPPASSTSASATSPGFASRRPPPTRASTWSTSARSSTPGCTPTSARSWTRFRSRFTPSRSSCRPGWPGRARPTTTATSAWPT